MGAKSLNDIARAGLDVMLAVIDGVTGLVTAQLGNVVTQKPTSNDDEWYFPPGYVGLPKSPDAGKAASQVAVITRSDHNQIVGCRDARDAAIVTAVGLDYGETLVFSPAGGGYVVFRKDGSVKVQSGNGEFAATISNTGIALGPSPQAVTFGAFTQQLIIMLQTLLVAMEGDPLLPILLPSTYSAVQAAVVTINALVSTFAETGQTQNTTAT